MSSCILSQPSPSNKRPDAFGLQHPTNPCTAIRDVHGDKLKSIIDKDLQKIYKLPDVEIFNDINDITTAFKKTLEDFYK